MPTTYFDTINGRIVSEYTNGVQLDYLTDALGSVTGVCDQTGTLVGSARYKPYGATLSQSGTTISMGWVGSKGYRATGLAHSEFYVKRRHDSDSDGRWTSVDPLWPAELSYAYCICSPTTKIDPSGLNCPKSCSPEQNNIALASGRAMLDASASQATCSPSPVPPWEW